VKPSELIGVAGRQRIEAAVRAAEKHTSGEIVVAVVGDCDEYGAAGWRCGVLLAALVFLGFVSFAEPAPPLAYFGAQGLALLAGHLLARIDPVRRLFVAEQMLEEAARRRAWSSFAELGLRHTETRTGILIFVALFEHRVVVLADEGIHRALGPGERWEEIVDLVLAGIRADRPVEGIEDAVRRCGEILSHPLPPRTDDRDEISRGLVLED
jgi:putative membrane protein